MKILTSTVRVGCAVALCGALAACSLFREPEHAPPPPPPAPVVPAAQPPVATWKFTVAPSHDDVVGVVQSTVASKEDTLTDIARRFNIGYEDIVRANPGVDVWVPGAGRQILLPTQFVLPDAPRNGIVINIPAMRLYYFPPHKKGEPLVVYTFPIGLGKVGWKTPEGTTRIVRRQAEPTWRPPVSVIKEHHENGDELASVIGPGPDNPLGHYAFYLAWNGYLIHGTNKPAGVGLRSSHGCIRLYPEDIEFLFNNVPLGTPVHVVNQPYVFGWRDGQLYMQAFGPFEDDARNGTEAQQQKLLDKSLKRVHEDLKQHGLEVNQDLLHQLAMTPRGVPVPVTVAGANLDTVLAGVPKVENRIPDGATWDGKTDLPMDEKTFQQVFSEREPQTLANGVPHKPGS